VLEQDLLRRCDLSVDRVGQRRHTLHRHLGHDFPRRGSFVAAFLTDGGPRPGFFHPIPSVISVLSVANRNDLEPLRAPRTPRTRREETKAFRLFRVVHVVRGRPSRHLTQPRVLRPQLTDPDASGRCSRDRAWIRRAKKSAQKLPLRP
jgi:hypothetical protein